MIDEFWASAIAAAAAAANGGEAFLLPAAGALRWPPAMQSAAGGVFGYFISVLVFFLAIVLPLLLIVPAVLNWRKNRYLLRHGAPARAKILEIRDTGVTVNDNPQVDLRLAVYAENLEPYEARTTKVVSRLKIPQIQVGASVEVRYDRQNPAAVALVI